MRLLAAVLLVMCFRAEALVLPLRVIASPINLSCVATRQSGVAPLAVFFDCTGTTDASVTSRPFLDIQYSWNFGDTNVTAAGTCGTAVTAGEGFWRCGSGAGANSKNIALGPTAAHVFENAGTYTVAVTVYDGTNPVVTQSIQITVTDPNTVFSANTVCVANGSTPVGGAAGCPSWAYGLDQSNFKTAIDNSIATGCGGGGCRRVLFKAGDSFTASAQINLSIAGPILIGSYGSGAKPSITAYNGDLFLIGGASFSDWRLMDLSVDLGGGTLSRFIRSTSNIQKLLVLRCDATNGFHGINISDATLLFLADDIHVVDTVFTDLTANATNGQGYFGYVTRSSYMGGYVSNTRSHNARFPYIAKGVISNNTHTLTINASANFKIHAPNWGQNPGSYTENLVFSSNDLSNSVAGWLVELQPQSVSGSSCTTGINPPGCDERIRNVVVERNFFKSLSGANSAPLSISAVDVSVRNNVFDTSANAAEEFMLVQRFATCAPACEPLPSGVGIFNNTAYRSVAGDIKGFYIGAGVASGGVTIKNNLCYGPIATSSPACYTNLGTGTVIGFNTGDAGDGVTGTITTDPLFTSVSPFTPANARPTVGSYAIDGGTSVPVWSDFGLNAITGTREIGAWQY